MVLLRQFVDHSEPASFKRVQTIVHKHDEQAGNVNQVLLTNWGRYHKKLLARSPRAPGL